MTRRGAKLVKLGIRDVVLANFPQHSPPGHEQEGLRPAIIIGWSDAHYPMVRLLPTSTLIDEKTGIKREWSDDFPEIFPVFPKGTGGLERDSILLANQTRWLGRDRIVDHYGSLTVREYAVVANALRFANSG